MRIMETNEPYNYKSFLIKEICDKIYYYCSKFGPDRNEWEIATLCAVIRGLKLSLTVLIKHDEEFAFLYAEYVKENNPPIESGKIPFFHCLDSIKRIKDYEFI